MKFFLFCLSLVFFSSNSLSSELDSYTLRDEVLEKKDSLEFLNKIVQNSLKKGQTSLSKKAGCRKKKLISAVKKQLVGGFAVPFPQCRLNRSYPWVTGFKGAFESLIQKGKGNYKDYTLPMEKEGSIFQNITKKESSAFSRVLGTLLNVRGLVIGADKFGHFFSQGHEYFSLGGTREIDKVLEYGHCLETKVLGLSTSGVYSYGDLAANIMGMLFWERVAGEYFICEEKKWKLNPNKKFNWIDYVSPSWDEGINNSFYYSKSITEKVKKEIIKLQNSKNTFLTPPISQSYCEEMVNFFGKESNFGLTLGKKISKHAISPVCLNIFAKITREREKGIFGSKINLKKWTEPSLLLFGEPAIFQKRSKIMFSGVGSYLNFNDLYLDPFWQGDLSN